ncbi:ABC transporter substrate-binding protein [Mucilaginibacter daejeonensis]|uniref:ABC transporter substrate-binding protein n=1 Tax=Mucilaginibacter daejeonensis TaxID=398049 RepID=UPI001D178104|nr:ABC transporter substrate-binding protein [Mucilaginibacter daejeonensis]UEG53051.1 ABC transporter substrate-binding protein [Mucilaginibacter daejeonensis]
MYRYRIFILGVMMAILTACGHQEEKGKRTVFAINLDQGLTSMDPAFARNQNALWMDNQVFNGLVQIDDSLHIKPCVAKSWELSTDGLLYTFHLRKDVYFQDDPLFKGGKGRLATAADMVYSFGRLIDPKVASSGSWIFSDKVTGKEAFMAPNDSTFQIKLKQPFPPLLALLTAQYCSVVPHEVVDHYGKDFRSHPVGTGPFRFKYWKEGEVMVLLKNPNYWEKDAQGHRLPYLDAIKATFISDKQTAFMEFIKQKHDFFNGIDGSYRDDILTKGGSITRKYKGKFSMSIAPFLNTEYLGILVDTNLAIVKNSPLRMLKVRQAINYAINKGRMIKYLRNSTGTPGYAGFIPQGMPGYDSTAVHGYRYDIEKAKRLLAEAGFPGGRNLPDITLSTTVSYRDLIEFIQGELQKVGITTHVELVQGASLRELIAKNGVNFFRASWIADYPDGENYLSVFYGKNKIPFGPNYTGFHNKKFDALFEQAYHVSNDTARFKLYQQMDDLMMQQAPVVILYYDKLVNLYQNNISGVHINAQNLLILKDVKKN